MTDQKLRAAQATAEAHAKIDEDVRAIYLLESDNEDDPEEPFKLLEVVEGTPELGVEPIGFPPNSGRGVPYPSIIVEISPREFLSIGKEILLDDVVWRVTKELVPHALGV